MLKTVAFIYLFGSAGVGLEVIFTGVSDYWRKGDARLTGYSYIWMFPIYGRAYPMFVWLRPAIQDSLLPARGIIYVVLLLTVEYCTGWLLRLSIGCCPWEENYEKARWSIHGLIRLDYAPAWFAACVLFERLYVIVTSTR